MEDFHFMKALQITDPGQFEIREVAVPEAGPGEVLLKVLSVTTCPHWDLHIFGGEPMFPGMVLDYPYTLGQPGHEACGEVAAVGEGVTEVSVGQRVCAWRDPGHHVQGCYAQYVVKPVSHVIPVPEPLAPEACAPLELAMCVSAHLMLADKLDAVAGHRAGVFGLGPAGLVAVQLLRAAGAAEVVGFDPVPSRRDMALSMGAAKVYETAEGFPARGMDGCLHCAFDCVGVQSAVHQAMEATSHLVVLFAVQREPYIYAPKFWPGLVLAGTQPHTREAAEYAAARMADGRLDMRPLVTHVLPLEEYARAVDLLRTRQAVKIAFSPW